MSRSSNLKLADVRRVYRLVGDIRAGGRDPAVWSRHMAEELIRLVGAKTAFAGEVYDTGEGKIYNGFLAVGLTDTSDINGMGRFVTSPEATGSRYMRAFSDHHYKRFVGTRDQYFKDADWYRSDFYHNYRAPCGIDGWLHSQFHIRGISGTHMICLSRPPGDRRFSNRDIRILQLFHDEMRQLWKDSPMTVSSEMNSEVEIKKSKLSPRLRETLDRLMAGDSEKQVALNLGVSYHAAHANVKRLHRHFGVSSRGELLSTMSQPSTKPEYNFTPRLVGPPANWVPPVAVPAAKHSADLALA